LIAIQAFISISLRRFLEDQKMSPKGGAGICGANRMTGHRWRIFERLAGEEFRGLRTQLYLFEREAAVRLMEAG
jgi:hypothetical protein